LKGGSYQNPDSNDIHTLCNALSTKEGQVCMLKKGGMLEDKTAFTKGVKIGNFH